MKIIKKIIIFSLMIIGIQEKIQAMRSYEELDYFFKDELLIDPKLLEPRAIYGLLGNENSQNYTYCSGLGLMDTASSSTTHGDATELTAVAWSPDSKYIAAAFYSPQSKPYMYIFDYNSFPMTRENSIARVGYGSKSGRRINAIAWGPQDSQGNSTIVVGSDNSIIPSYQDNLSSQDLYNSVQGQKDYDKLRFYKFGGNGIFDISLTPTIFLSRLRSYALDAYWLYFTGIKKIAFSPDGRFLATIQTLSDFRDPNNRWSYIVIFKMNGDEKAVCYSASFKIPNKYVFDSIDWHPTGKYLLTGFHSSTTAYVHVIAWDEGNFTNSSFYSVDTSDPSPAPIAPINGPIIIWGAGIVMYSDPHSGLTTQSIQFPILDGYSFGLSDITTVTSPHQFYTSGMNYQITLTTFPPLVGQPLENNYPVEAKFSPDGTAVAVAQNSASQSRKASLVRMLQFSEKRGLEDFSTTVSCSLTQNYVLTQTISALTWSPDGSMLAAGGKHKTYNSYTSTYNYTYGFTTVYRYLYNYAHVNNYVTATEVHNYKLTNTVPFFIGNYPNNNNLYTLSWTPTAGLLTRNNFSSQAYGRPYSEILTAAWSPDGKNIIFGGRVHGCIGSDYQFALDTASTGTFLMYGLSTGLQPGGLGGLSLEALPKFTSIADFEDGDLFFGVGVDGYLYARHTKFNAAAGDSWIKITGVPTGSVISANNFLFIIKRTSNNKIYVLDMNGVAHCLTSGSFIIKNATASTRFNFESLVQNPNSYPFFMRLGQSSNFLFGISIDKSTYIYKDNLRQWQFMKNTLLS